MQARAALTTKPSKQRKRMYLAPDHLRVKFFAALLSPELRKAHGTRNLPVRRGDTVRIMRGDHKEFEGKVTRVDRNKYRIYVEGLTREKVDGTTILVPIHPSKVMITKLNLDDKWRRQILERKKGILRKVEEAAEKHIREAAKETTASGKEPCAPAEAEKPKPRKKPLKKPSEKKGKKSIEKQEKKSGGAKRKYMEETQGEV